MEKMMDNWRGERKFQMIKSIHPDTFWHLLFKVMVADGKAQVPRHGW